MSNELGHFFQSTESLDVIEHRDRCGCAEDEPGPTTPIAVDDVLWTISTTF